MFALIIEFTSMPQQLFPVLRVKAEAKPSQIEIVSDHWLNQFKRKSGFYKCWTLSHLEMFALEKVNFKGHLCMSNANLQWQMPVILKCEVVHQFPAWRFLDRRYKTVRGGFQKCQVLKLLIMFLIEFWRIDKSAKRHCRDKKISRECVTLIIYKHFGCTVILKPSGCRNLKILTRYNIWWTPPD